MSERLLDKDTIHFQTEGRLLQELGLRLVASPEVALVELIKNAYDADSPSCTVRLTDNASALVISDDGHGMTLRDFKSKWMRIATSSKLNDEHSPKFHRPLTGAKGIGRFAVRYLGDLLNLESVAYDTERNCVTRLVTNFDWPKLDSAQDVSKVEVTYALSQLPDKTPSGTTLTVRKLRSGTDFTRSTNLRDKIVSIVSPLEGLERGAFEKGKTSEGRDPGFKVILPGETNSEDVNLAKLLMDNYWGRLTVELTGKRLTFRVWLPTLKKPRELRLQVPTKISRGFFADIRYFPRRAGVFKRKGIDGRKAWRWEHEQSGVKVVDHGFHIRPYGFLDDDWLLLDRSRAHSQRDWSTEIARKHFPVSKVEKADPAANPVLYLPRNRQLIGAAFVETRRNLGAKDQVDLVSAMDREGLLENPAFAQLTTLMRAGLEFLAREDKAELDRQAAAKAREVAKTAREEIKQAIEFIQRSPSLTAPDKFRIVKQYRNLAEIIDKQEQYSDQARRNLLTMSLLGVVAGFMTHESKAVVHDLEVAATEIRRLAHKDPKILKIAEDLEVRLENFRGYLDYSRLFVQGVRTAKEEPLSAAGQVRFVLNRFQGFADERGIRVTSQIPTNIKTPPLPVTVYSGVLLNLYTNALKAVAAAQRSIRKPQISFRAWNEKDKHVVEVADNGVGIPPEMRKRIWDPLYTTTSDTGNPLGSGMGLGLTLVKQVISEFGGSIKLIDEPPPGFSTCFRVTFPTR
ncbi:MAG TPA: sensor histidine kinase [Pyrinomonadaceae bacterium]|nr:sensor histidine kinase [Pyrinomonadaceae bacterium]